MYESSGYRIRKLRHEFGKTIEQVANAVDISPSALGMYERGMRNPDIKVLLKISNYFQVDLKVLYDGDNDDDLEAIQNIIEKKYDAKKIAEAKLISDGKCDLCQEFAPFICNNGEPYLEVYEVEEDEIVLLCPNCKKKMDILNLPGDVIYLKRKLRRHNEY